MTDPRDTSIPGTVPHVPGRSSICLPALAPPPDTILEFLADRFPHVGRDVWHRRMVEGKVMRSDGEALMPASRYRAGTTIVYHREVGNETVVPFVERIVFRNDHLLIADKPHFLPVVPAGSSVEECLVARLRRSTGLGNLTPVHRLDRDTAGLVMLAIDPVTRPMYHRLFRERAIRKEYMAVANGTGVAGSEHTVTNRLGPGEPWFRMRVVEGEPNAVTHVRVMAAGNARALVRVRPHTGRKHQVRVHLATIGLPIVNDRLYPDVLPHDPADFTRPLRLVARRLVFVDPVSGETIDVVSGYDLDLDASAAESEAETR